MAVNSQFQPTSEPFSLGKIVVVAAGTPVKITFNFDSATPPASKTTEDPQNDLYVNKIFVQALPGNTGNLYVGMKTPSVAFNKTTGVGVLAVLAAGQSESITNPVGKNTYRAGNFVFDADVNGEGGYAFTDTV